ncbi:MAG: 16S rRNA (cytosine(1402)-N(4))-methyltransferase RsmH [bacterium]
MEHLPVMLEKVKSYLGGFDNGIVIDGTLGGGGHTEALLKNTPDSLIIVGLDRDHSAVQAASSRLSSYKSRFMAIHGNFGEPTAWIDKLPKKPIFGFLLDLGLSSMQLDSIDRGFSFKDPTSLDMRFDRTEPIPTAADLVNTLTEKEISTILYRYGEEKASKKIARAIIDKRKSKLFTTGLELWKVISSVATTSGSIDPATRTFQALRIAVNKELDYLEKGLAAAESLLANNGRLVVISYHSLEDRIVKTFLRERSGICSCPPGLPECRCGKPKVFKLITRKPVVPDEDEIQNNPRSRSAKLRCAERISGEKQ